MALALYRKYRPARFADVVGQEHVTGPLRVALEAGRITHAYLFSGPRGCGKTSSARILARSLNCAQGPTPEPCGECASCVALAPEGPGNIDVVELDAASHGGVDDARELRDRAFYAPAESRYRVFIVDEAHMVTTQGFNALLKIVEEPPDHLVFVFATTEPEKVLPTIRSRTHHYPFRLIPPGTLRGLLERICAEEGATVAPAVFPLVLRAGGGSARDTLSVLDQLLAGAGPEGITYERAVALLGVTDVALIDDAVDALAAGDRAAVFETVDRLVEAGLDPRRFAADLLQRLRDLTLVQAIPDAAQRGLVDAAADEVERMVEQAQRLGPATLARYGEILHAGLIEMRGATAPRLLLELLCARMLLPAASTSEPALLERLERIERRASIAPAPVPHGESAAAPPEPGATQSGEARRAFVRASRAEAGPSAEREPEVSGSLDGSESGSKPDVEPAAADDGGRTGSERVATIGGADSVAAPRSAAAATERAAREQVVPERVVPERAGPERAGPDRADAEPTSRRADAEPADRAAGRAAPAAAAADRTEIDPGGPRTGPERADVAAVRTDGASAVRAGPERGGTDATDRAVSERSPAQPPVDDPGAPAPEHPAPEPPAPEHVVRGRPAVTDAARRAPEEGSEPTRPDAAAAGGTVSRPEVAAAGGTVSRPEAAPADRTASRAVDAPERAADRRTRGPSDEPSGPPTVAASLDAAAVRRVWSEILAAAKQRSRSTGALMVNATVRAIDGDVLVLAIGSEPLARRLSEQRNTDVIADALYAVLGVRWRVRCDHGDAAPPAPARPAATRAAPPQRPSRPAPARRAASDDGVPLPPEPADDDVPPEDAEAMMAEAAADAAAPAVRRDPEEVAIELLSAQLGATAIERR